MISSRTGNWKDSEWSHFSPVFLKIPISQSSHLKQDLLLKVDNKQEERGLATFGVLKLKIIKLC